MSVVVEAERVELVVAEPVIVHVYSHDDEACDSKCTMCLHPLYLHGWVDTVKGSHLVCPDG